jgi:putative heme iron utilization protein
VIKASRTPVEPAPLARALTRSSRRAALGTRDAENGAPYVSLVAPATAADGAPLLLLSRLARHTRNLEADPRAALLVDDRAAGDPMIGARLTVNGRMARIDDEAARARFLARQPGARTYAGFADFDLWRLEPESAHLVAGFGRIVDLGREALLVDTRRAGSLLAAEAEIAAHMNADHADAVALYATALLGAPPGPWRFEGVDPEGCELGIDGWGLYLPFDQPVDGPGPLRQALVRLAAEARAAASSEMG